MELTFLCVLLRENRPFYVDRITYELDLMAPIAKPFRKAIDINCASGDWAMVMKTPTYILETMFLSVLDALMSNSTCSTPVKDKSNINQIALNYVH